MNLTNIFLIGLVAGVVGTGAGGIVAILTHRKTKLPFSTLLGLAAGIMLAVIFEELIAHAIEDGGLIVGTVGVMLGILIMMALDTFLPHKELSDDSGGHNVSLRRVGVLIGIGIAMHNFPEGVAIGASYAREPVIGLTLAIVLVLHNIPEGMAMAVPLAGGGVPSLKVLWFTALAGIPMGIGSLLGGLIGQTSPIMLGLGLGFAGGAMLYITCHELIPGAQKRAHGHAATVGIAVGAIVTLIFLELMHH